MNTQFSRASHAGFEYVQTTDKDHDLNPLFSFGYRSFQDALERTIKAIQPLPANAIFLGVADNDGQPVLLNINSPDNGALLINGKSSSGKTALLQVIASGISYTHCPIEVQYAVITSRPWEWVEWKNSQYCSGIFVPDERQTVNLLTALELWMMRSNHEQAFLLFMDDLDAVTKMDLSSQNKLRQILALGSSCRVWPIATVNVECLGKENPNLSFFKTHLRCLSEASTSIFDCKYLMEESSNWIMFSVLI